MKHRRWWTAVIILLIATVVEYKLARAEAAAPHPVLDTLASSIDGWDAQDIPIAPRLVQVAHVDEYLNRLYHKPLEAADVGLYVGYYRSQRAGDAVHSPKNCLPGSGWQPVSASRARLPLHAGAPAEVNVYVVEYEGQRYVVLYWYQSHGRIIASEYRAKLYTVRDAIMLNRTDSALVRITVPVANSEPAARRTAIAFASLISPELDRVIPQ